MSSWKIDNIKTLLEKLESLKIVNKASSETNEQSDKEMSVALAMINENI